eukprot:gene24210-25934_t
MAEVTNELMLEILKSVHAEVRGLKEWRIDVYGEFNAVRSHMSAMQADINNLHSKLGSVEIRLNRIEQRLDMIDTLVE